MSVLHPSPSLVKQPGVSRPPAPCFFFWLGAGGRDATGGRATALTRGGGGGRGALRIVRESILDGLPRMLPKSWKEIRRRLRGHLGGKFCRFDIDGNSGP